jgi:hypothetical protein
MSKVIEDTIAEFWSFIVNAFGGVLPWVFALVALVSIALVFRGRFAARWLFPLALIAGAAWANHHWRWIQF